MLGFNVNLQQVMLGAFPLVLPQFPLRLKRTEENSRGTILEKWRFLRKTNIISPTVFGFTNLFWSFNSFLWGWGGLKKTHEGKIIDWGTMGHAFECSKTGVFTNFIIQFCQILNSYVHVIPWFQKSCSIFIVVELYLCVYNIIHDLVSLTLQYKKQQIDTDVFCDFGVQLT